MFETLTEDMKVEVTVTCGRIHGVSLGTIVTIPRSDKSKGGARLREVILFLKNSLPVNEIKRSDEEFIKPSTGAAITKDGEVIPAPNDLLDTNRKIVATRSTLKLDQGGEAK